MNPYIESTMHKQTHRGYQFEWYPTYAGVYGRHLLKVLKRKLQPRYDHELTPQAQLDSFCIQSNTYDIQFGVVVILIVFFQRVEWCMMIHRRFKRGMIVVAKNIHPIQVS